MGEGKRKCANCTNYFGSYFCGYVSANCKIYGSLDVDQCERHPDTTALSCGQYKEKAAGSPEKGKHQQEPACRKIKKLILAFIGRDSRGRPVYVDNNERLWKDTEPRPNKPAHLCTALYNQFDGEPDTPLEMLERYKDAQIIFEPKRDTENWKAKKWEPQGSFCLPLDKVEVLEVKQEESTNNTREQLRAHGFDLTPRKQTDRGGILCLPLDKNLNGDVQAKHPDWEPVECPTCGRKCWKHPEADRLAKEQGAKMLCTECAIKAGLLSPFRKEGPNRAQRRRAKRERRK